MSNTDTDTDISATNTETDTDISATNAKEYDPRTLPESFSMIIFGRRRSGKTYQLRKLVYDIRKRFTEVYLFSDTSHLQDEDYSYIPSVNRIRGLDESKLKEITAKQEEIIQMNKNRNKRDKIKSSPLIILDDIISDPKVRKSPTLNSMYTLGRHLGISIITLTQCIGGRHGLPPPLRANCDVVIAFYAHSEVDRKALCEQYASVTEGGSKEGAMYFKSIASQEHTSAVFDIVNVQARNYTDYVYKYKVPKKQPKFLIGKKEALEDKGLIMKDKTQKTTRSNLVPNSERYEFSYAGRQKPDVNIRFVSKQYDDGPVSTIKF